LVEGRFPGYYFPNELYFTPSVVVFRWVDDEGRVSVFQLKLVSLSHPIRAHGPSGEVSDALPRSSFVPHHMFMKLDDAFSDAWRPQRGCS
jgi:hypothetical protein